MDAMIPCLSYVAMQNNSSSTSIRNHVRIASTQCHDFDLFVAEWQSELICFVCLSKHDHQMFLRWDIVHHTRLILQYGTKIQFYWRIRWYIAWVLYKYPLVGKWNDTSTTCCVHFRVLFQFLSIFHGRYRRKICFSPKIAPLFHDSRYLQQIESSIERKEKYQENYWAK